MRHIDLNAIETVASQLEKLGLKYAFAGGAATGFLVDNPSVTVLRPTKDVDAIVAVITRMEYTDLEEKLRGLGFQHDTSEDAPICRWLYHNIRVDVMPEKDTTGHLSDQWFSYALATASVKTLGGLSVPVISAAGFIATKVTAFYERGNGDYASHDLEDIITVIDGRKSIVDEIGDEPDDVKSCIVQFARKLLADQAFLDWMPGLLPGDTANQQRVPKLHQRLKRIAELL